MSNYYGLIRKLFLPNVMLKRNHPFNMQLKFFANEASKEKESSNKTAEEEVTDEVPTAEKFNELKAAFEKAKTEAADFKDKYVRSLAESENARRRNKKMLEDSKLYSIQSFCKDLLEVADVLERATESVPKEELDKNQSLKSLYEGLSMTEVQLQKVFKNHGLEKLHPLNEKFDPHFHEALFQLPGENSGTVAVVQKTGYRLHGRPLRAALVGVVK